VPLILNLLTLTITPQFHIVFDDWFTSVSSSSRPDAPISNLVWSDLLENSPYQYFFDDDDEVKLSLEWLTENEQAQREHQERDTQLQQHQQKDVQPEKPEREEDIGQGPAIVGYPPIPLLPREEVPSGEPPPADQEEFPTGKVPSSPQPCRSAPLCQQPTCFISYNGTQGFGYNAEAINRQQVQATALISTLIDRLTTSAPRDREGTYRSLMSTYLSEGYADYSDPIAYAAATRADPDTLRYHEAKRASDWGKFGEAATLEIATLEKLGTWNEVL
jgi:hypothetical protein